MFGVIFSWTIKNYKAAIAIFAAALTLVISPMFFATSGFVMMGYQTSAKASYLETQNEMRRSEIVNLGNNISGMKAVLDRIEAGQVRLEEQKYQELKAARQQRLNAANP